MYVISLSAPQPVVADIAIKKSVRVVFGVHDLCVDAIAVVERGVRRCKEVS